MLVGAPLRSAFAAWLLAISESGMSMTPLSVDCFLPSSFYLRGACEAVQLPFDDTSSQSKL
eukprot:181154-Amphidinium_carterae.1